MYPSIHPSIHLSIYRVSPLSHLSLVLSFASVARRRHLTLSLSFISSFPLLARRQFNPLLVLIFPVFPPPARQVPATTNPAPNHLALRTKALTLLHPLYCCTNQSAATSSTTVPPYIHILHLLPPPSTTLDSTVQQPPLCRCNRLTCAVRDTFNYLLQRLRPPKTTRAHSGRDIDVLRLRAALSALLHTTASASARAHRQTPSVASRAGNAPHLAPHPPSARAF